MERGRVSDLIREKREREWSRAETARSWLTAMIGGGANGREGEGVGWLGDAVEGDS